MVHGLAHLNEFSFVGSVMVGLKKIHFWLDTQPPKPPGKDIVMFFVASVENT